MMLVSCGSTSKRGTDLPIAAAVYMLLVLADFGQLSDAFVHGHRLPEASQGKAQHANDDDGDDDVPAAMGRSPPRAY
eukprot:12415838-Karenia_brevis.AAC.1